MEEKVLETEWLKLSNFNNRWIFGMGDLMPIKISTDFCRHNGISVWDLKKWDKMGLLFNSEKRAKEVFVEMMGRVKIFDQYREAMDAWWNPEDYYKISKR